MKRFERLPLDKLGSDVAVDSAHVAKLAESIRKVGPIAPLLVRAETGDLIDGFHRVAAMREAGLTEAECILFPCTDEDFWDLRIISAVQHEEVAYARVVDWVERAYQAGPIEKLIRGATGEAAYVNAFSLICAVRQGGGTKEAVAWANDKADKWGVKLHTLEMWLEADKNLVDELRQQARSAEPPVNLHSYQEVGRVLPKSKYADLQPKVIKKAIDEGLGHKQVRAVGQALKATDDPEERQTILEEPVARTSEEMGRTAKVAKLLKDEPPAPTRERRERANKGELLFLLMDMETLPGKLHRVKPETVESLTDDQKAELGAVVNLLDQELHRLRDLLGVAVVAELVEETGLIRR